ncbi:hypothetical protein NFI96_031988 [Prochilodus magdalenae]|nr:hypothetical protein NFI96_031988 [Prochilodus magdalenae]
MADEEEGKNKGCQRRNPPNTQQEHANHSEEEECEPSSAQRPTENASEIANLRQILQGLLNFQHQKDEELQREARRQDQRWRLLQHQFGLLQEEVRRDERKFYAKMEKAQEQKLWYDKAARRRVLKPGQKVLILLPTSDTGLLAKWQGPQVMETTYELHLPERKMKFQSFRFNMLRLWNEPDSTSAEQLWIRAVEEEEEVKEQYFPTGSGCEVIPVVSHLSAHHQEELLRVIPSNLFSANQDGRQCPNTVSGSQNMSQSSRPPVECQRA